MGAPTAPGAWARYLNVIAGAWLFISAFLWSQGTGARWNGWIVGIAVAVVAIWSLWVEGVRFLNTALGIWLFLSALWIFRLAQAPRWNDVIVSIIVFALSLVPNVPQGSGRVGRPATRAY